MDRSEAGEAFEKWLDGDGDQYTVSEIEMNAARAAWNAALAAARERMPERRDGKYRQEAEYVSAWNECLERMDDRLDDLVAKESPDA